MVRCVFPTIAEGPELTKKTDADSSMIQKTDSMQVANDVEDFCNRSLLYGTTFEIKDIKNPGYAYGGLNSGSLSGTLISVVTVDIILTTINYSISCNCWIVSYFIVEIYF